MEQILENFCAFYKFTAFIRNFDNGEIRQNERRFQYDGIRAYIAENNGVALSQLTAVIPIQIIRFYTGESSEIQIGIMLLLNSCIINFYRRIFFVKRRIDIVYTAEKRSDCLAPYFLYVYYFGSEFHAVADQRTARLYQQQRLIFAIFIMFCEYGSNRLRVQIGRASCRERV